MPCPKLIGRGFGHFVAPESLDQWDKHIIGVLGHEEKQTCDLTLKREDGSSFYALLDSIRMAVLAEHTEVNKGTYVIRTTVTDITERKLTEGAAKQSEEKFRTATDFTYDWEYWIGPDHRLIYVSPSCERITGYRSDEFMNNPDLLEEIIYPADRSLVGNQFDTIGSGDAYEVDFRIVTRKGETRWIGHRGQGVHSKDGRWLGHRASNRDITDRKRIEEALLESEERLRGMFESHSAIMLMIEPVTGRIMDANEAAVLFYGYTVSQLRSMSIQDINALSPDNAEAQRNLALEEHRSHLIFPHRLANGEVRTVEVHSSPIEQNGAILLFSIIHDITERKRAEQMILNTLAYAENIVNTVREPLVVLDGEMHVVSANNSFYRMFDVTSEETQRNLLYDLGNRQWDIPRLHELLEDILPEKAEVRDFEVDHVFPEIGHKILFLNARQVIHGLGEEERKLILLAIEDITERKRLEEERLEIQHKLLRAQKLESLGMMAGGIAHDFNNQLAVVLGNLEMALMDLPPDSEAKASIMNAIQASKRSAELSRKMQVYTGNVLYYPVDLDLNEFLNRNPGLLKLTVSKHVSLNFESCNTLPLIKGDADQIQRVVMNILVNASEAIGDQDGDVTLRTGVMDCDEAYLSRSHLEERPSPGRYVFLEVTDTGCGMDAETLHKLFDPFFTTKFWGRGLGMAEVVGIVKGHHGAIIVDSEVGKGTTIRVLFPAPKEVQVSSVQVMDVVETKVAAPEIVTGRKMILVVEDEKLVRDLAVKRLELLGYDSITAADGEEGVSIFRDRLNEIDLVMLDFKMPKMDGVEAFGVLIRIKPDVKVILSSGYTEDEVIERFPGRRPSGILHKPYDMVILRAELERLLGTVV